MVDLVPAVIPTGARRSASLAHVSSAYSEIRPDGGTDDRFEKSFEPRFFALQTTQFDSKARWEALGGPPLSPTTRTISINLDFFRFWPYWPVPAPNPPENCSAQESCASYSALASQRHRLASPDPRNASPGPPNADLEVILGISGCCRSLVERRWGRSRKGANRSGVELKKDHY